MNSDKQRISIVIPCKDEESALQYLLKDLKNQTLNSDTMEIIVSDAGSKDKTTEIARKYGARIVKGGIPSVGRNRGAKAAKGNTIIFLDADVRLPYDSFLKDMLAEFNEKKLDCATTLRLPHFDGINISYYRKLLINAGYRAGNVLLYFLSKGNHPRAMGDAMVLRRQLVMKNEGFREDMYWGEDSELAERLRMNGYRFACLSLKIRCSARKIVKHGLLNTAWNIQKLDRARFKTNNLTETDFRRITGIKDYYKK